MDHLARTKLLLGDGVDKLRQKTVAVFGLGGVGGHVVEALARTGIGHLILVDHDMISITNINRQLLATNSTVGMSKVSAAAQRVRDIDPTIEITEMECFYGPDTDHLFDFSKIDYAVDAIDTVTGKLQLITAAKAANCPVICCMGTGNKLDPSRFQITDISKTTVCPLARIMRKECAKRGLKHIKVLFSTEDPLPGGQPDSEAPEGRRSVPGSVAFVPGVAGLMIAGEVIKDLIK